MGTVASKGQLRMSFVRWAAVFVPLVLLLGFLSGRTVAAGDDNPWYAALTKPGFTPADGVFPIAWSILYLLLGVALSMVLAARGARLRWPAVAAFLVQFALMLAWMPLFFGSHKVGAALGLLVAVVIVSLVTASLFWRVRRTAALLMLPYIAWVVFATVLTFEIDRLNPYAETLVPPSGTSQMLG